MDKQAATERLDALEREAKELRKIIEGPDGLIYDDRKFYVKVNSDGAPFVLVGRKNADYFNWHCLTYYPVEMASRFGFKSAQEALDDEKIADIHVFDDEVEGMTFFYEQYMKAHGRKK